MIMKTRTLSHLRIGVMSSYSQGNLYVILNSPSSEVNRCLSFPVSSYGSQHFWEEGMCISEILAPSMNVRTMRQRVTETEYLDLHSVRKLERLGEARYR